MFFDLVNGPTNGFRTRHQIRFLSERWQVQGGIQQDDAKERIEFVGFLFDQQHSATHLCVAVDAEKDWHRKSDWHGMVARKNVTQIVLQDDDGNLLSSDRAKQQLTEEFFDYWIRETR